MTHAGRTRASQYSEFLALLPKKMSKRTSSSRSNPRLPTMLFHHPDNAHDHAANHRLAHVIHSQQANLHRSERFHFHAGLAEGLHLRFAMNTRIPHIGPEIHRHPRQPQRMAQRYQIAGALRRPLAGGDRGWLYECAGTGAVAQLMPSSIFRKPSSSDIGIRIAAYMC